MPIIVLYLLLYIIEVIPVYVIAQKSGHEYAWMAFIPIANLWLLCDMADMEVWFLIVWLIPYVNFIFLEVIWWRIAENTNKPGWIGLLMPIPLINLPVGYYLAFAEGGRFNA